MRRPARPHDRWRQGDNYAKLQALAPTFSGGCDSSNCEQCMRAVKEWLDGALAAHRGLEPPVLEMPVGGDDAAYRFKYTGLKLFVRTKKTYWLRPSDENVRTNIFLPGSPDLRLEFTRPRR